MKKIGISLLLIALLTGCYSGSLLTRANGDRRSYGIQISPGDLRQETYNLLGNYLLFEEFKTDPQSVIRKLQGMALKEPHRHEIVLAMADLCNYAAEREEDLDLSAQFQLTSCFFSYLYLMVDAAKETGYSLNRVAAIQVYNRALTELFSYLKEKNLYPRNAYQMTMINGKTVRFISPMFDMPFGGSHYSDFELCADYRVTGLTHTSYQFGLGVPLIALPSENSEDPDVENWDTEMPSPATLLLRFYRGQEEDSFVDGRLSFIGPKDDERTKLNGYSIPLALDFSTPLAYETLKPPLLNRVQYMIDPMAGELESGLYFLEPYDPEKIPVVLVHGLLSDYRTWIQMINTLKSDPVLRRKYQFWYFSYSSGNPILYSAKMLRDSLSETRTSLVNKKESVENFDKMVLVGHSMGGLVCKAQLFSNNGDLILEQFGGIKLENLCEGLSPEQQDFVRELMYFERQKHVSRVIFISVPHRGSELARTWIGRLGTKLVTLPAFLDDSGAGVLTSLTEKYKHFGDPDIFRPQTGIDNLNPQSSALRLLNNLKLPDDLPYHSIIGNTEAEGQPGGSDGIVPYWSSHLDNAKSEKVVKSNHSAQQDPLAIQEVRRILLEHLILFKKIDGEQIKLELELLNEPKKQQD